MFVQVDVSIDRSRGGLGIGLALVRAIVELHGGRVAAWSKGLGHGSSLTIELPLTPQLVEQPPLEDSPATVAGALPPPSGALRRVLIVEDNADARETLKDLLTASGYQVTAVDNGKDGLERIVDEVPDLAIVDVGLPGLDGFEVARRARAAIGKATRLVAFTGYNSPAVRAAALEAGFDMHVPKPCTAERLGEILSPPAGESRLSSG
jgi:CheY-like chemotaxis protein